MASYSDTNKRLKTNGGGPAVPSRSTAASVSRPANNKLRLTVKAPPSKLRQATSGEHIHVIPPNPYADASESDATPQPVSRVARSTRNPRTVIEPDSDDVDDPSQVDSDEERGDFDDEDAALPGGSEEDAEGDAEAEDDDMDELQRESSPAPVIEAKGKPLTKAQPPAAVLKSVEDQEMEDDDELSELDSNDDENEDELDDDDEEDEGNSDDDSENEGSRSDTPDLTKLTRRQRGQIEEDPEGDLLALSNEAQKKKVFTEEEHAMRRQEMARRRKNLSEKRNEEEKMDTINKLLKKPAPKRRTRAEILAAQHAAEMAGTPGAEDGGEERADPLFARYISNRNGSRVSVPDEWLEAPPGELFRKTQSDARSGSRMLVEEVS